MKPKNYTISDGKILLHLKPAPEGGFIVTSPLDPALITQAESIPEAFQNARDAAKSLRQSRAIWQRKLAKGVKSKRPTNLSL